MTGGLQVWNFPMIEGAMDSLQGTQTQVNALLEEGRGLLGTLAAQWGGQSSSLWQAEQTKWSINADNINTAFLQLITAGRSANAHMQSTEMQVGARFA